MFALVFAGEMIFSLPFHLPRYFRASVLEAFAFSNADLGDVFAIYGITAMLAYFPGGALADRVPARALMCVSLLATAAGGLYLLRWPGQTGLALLYGWWGVSTILLFWAAMIRATREWGGVQAQGRAFGLLDGGRGLVAALGASAAVLLFGSVAGVPDDAVLTAAMRRAALERAILLYTAATAGAAALVWRWVPAGARPERARRPGWTALRAVCGQPAVWLQAVVVVCAYCGYKGLDNYALYAHQALGFSETAAAGFSAAAAWLRPFAAIAAGVIADRVGAGRTIVVLFATLAGAYAMLALQAQPATMLWLVYGNIGFSFCAVFALRGIYFALLAEAGVARAATGTAVGLVSLIGFTPDVFFAAVAGRLLDASPGVAGHQHYFILLAVIAIIGCGATLWLLRSARSATAPSNPQGDPA